MTENCVFPQTGGRDNITFSEEAALPFTHHFVQMKRIVSQVGND